MTKKNFTGGLSSLLGDNISPDVAEIKQEFKTAQKKKGGRPKTRTWEVTKSSEEGTKQDETRATFIVNKDLLEKIKAISYWDRTKIKDIVATALTEFISTYEKENGVIKPAPENK